MLSNFLTFQKFNDIAIANAVAERLRAHGIACVIEDNQKFFDPSFANNTIELDISLKLHPKDFTRAHKALEDYYKEQLGNVDPDYYLLEFTDDELVQIISKPDEWGHFDYQLALKLLADRGIEVNTELAELLKKQRLNELAKPEPVSQYWIYSGYLMPLFGLVILWAGIAAMVAGAVLVYHKKTLPNGERVYAYREEDRNHGTRMLVLSVVSVGVWTGVRLFLS